MFSVRVNIDGAVHLLETTALSAKDLEEPLAKFGGYMRKKAIRKYEAQNFAPLAESTLEQRARKGLRSAERKLNKDVRRSQKRATGGKTDILSQVLGSQSRGTRTRLAVLAAFQSQHGMRLTKVGMDASAHLRELSFKQQASLDDRVKRSVDKAVGKPILGNLGRSVVFELGKGRVTLASRTSDTWSDVHNEGGAAGHGAREPKRETIAVEPVDLEVLASILKSHMLLPFDRGMHGPGY